MTTVKVNSPAKIEPRPIPDPTADLQFSDLPRAVQYLAVFVVTCVTTVVALGIESQVTIPNLSLVFVLPVIGAAVAFGFGPSICAAVLGALAYNFFLTEPRYTLRVDDPANIWAIGLLFVVGCIASAVASTARRRGDDAALRKQEAATIRFYSRELVTADSDTAVLYITANVLEALFRVPVLVMSLSENSADIVEKRGGVEPRDEDIQAARASVSNAKVAVAGAYPFDDARFDFWPVATSTGRQVAIGLAFDPDERPPAPGTLVEVITSLLTLALDRLHLLRDLTAEPGEARNGKRY